VVEEVSRAEAPVQIEVLDEKGRGHEPRPIVHPPFALELAHPRVDERVASSTLAPGLECGRVVQPIVTPRLKVVVRQPRVGREKLGVEVAPRKLADERLRRGIAAQARHELERRDATEMEVRAEPGGLVRGDEVIPLAVVLRTRGKPALGARSALRLPALRQLGSDLPARQLREPGKRSRVQARGKPDRPGAGQDETERLTLPASPVPREDPVLPGRRHDRDAWVQVEADALGLERAGEPLLAPACIGTHVRARVDGPGAGLPRDANRLGHDVSLPEHDRPERALEIAQGVQEEPHAVRRAERREDGLVEDEERDDVLRRACGLHERRVVACPQDAVQEDDGRSQQTLPTARASPALSSSDQSHSYPGGSPSAKPIRIPNTVGHGETPRT